MEQNLTWKPQTDIDTSEFAKKADLASFKSKVDKIDVDKLETVPTDLSKSSNVVKNNFFKKYYIKW